MKNIVDEKKKASEKDRENEREKKEIEIRWRSVARVKDEKQNNNISLPASKSKLSRASSAFVIHIQNGEGVKITHAPCSML